MSITSQIVRTLDNLILLVSGGDPKSPGKLLIAQASVSIAALNYNNFTLGNVPFDVVTTGQQFFQKLSEYNSIDDLTIYCHGSDSGQMMFGPNPEDWMDPDLAVGKFGAGLKLPKVRAINVESCAVGLHAEKLVKFARAFQAQSISAWNYYHGSTMVGLEVGDSVLDDKKAEENMQTDIQKILDNVKEWWMPLTPDAATIIATAKSKLQEMRIKRPKKDSKGSGKLVVKIDVGLEWFRYYFDEASLPLSPPDDGSFDTRDREFFSRKGAIEETVAAGKIDVWSAGMLKKIPPMERKLTHVTVSLQ